MAELKHHNWFSEEYVRAWYQWKTDTNVDQEPLDRQLLLLQGLLRNKKTPCILDIGCGPGRFSKMILEAFPGACVLGVDFSPACGKVALEILGDHAKRFSFIEGNLDEPSWLVNVAPFDAVVSTLVVHDVAVESRKKLFEIILEILIPGGVFLNFDHVGYENPTYKDQLASLHDNYIASAPPIIKARLEDAGMDAGRETGMKLGETCLVLQQVGFEDVEVYYRWLSRAIYGGYKHLPEDPKEPTEFCHIH